MKALVGVLLVFMLSTAWADIFQEGLEVQCDQWQMRVRDFDLTNGAPGQLQNTGTTVYTDNKPHKAQCLINKHKVEIDFQVLGGTKCEVGSLVTLKIDGQLIVKDAQIHGCIVGITEIGVIPEMDSHGGFSLEVCGYTPHDQMPTFNGCVKVSANQLRSIIKLPLSPTFPIGELIKLVRFPS